jgi:hypothetical protein
MAAIVVALLASACTATAQTQVFASYYGYADAHSHVQSRRRGTHRRSDSADISNYSLRLVTLYAFTGSWNPLSWTGPTGSMLTRSVTVA